MKWIALIAAAAMLAGCQPTPPATETPAPSENPPEAATSAPVGSGGDSVQMHGSGAAGGLAPVTGTESLQGSGGGGVASAAKDSAKRAAAGASNRSYTGNDDMGGE